MVNSMKKQVNKTAYNFTKYCTQDRWGSYWHQIYTILQLNPESMLEIGVGDKVAASYIKNNTDIQYTSVDIADDLQPDIISSVEALQLADNSFDVVCAFEVLEHLPFDALSRALQELHRVSKKSVIISLPHWGRHFSIDIRLPLLGRMTWQYKCNLFPIRHRFGGQHYWEIGKRGFPLKKIKAEIVKAGFELATDYVAFNSPYHHFFILKKKIS